MIARFPLDVPVPADTGLGLRPDPTRLHLFRADNGAALT
jgi:hypothetical protein